MQVRSTQPTFWRPLSLILLAAFFTSTVVNTAHAAKGSSSAFIRVN